MDVVGKVTGNGNIRLKNFDSSNKSDDVSIQHPVDLDLKVVLGKMPQKKFHLKRAKRILNPLKLPLNLQVEEALSRVLRLPSVGSKRFLTNKVDRSVTGLIAQQQCVGPLHTPLADMALVSLSYWDTVGSAISVGEQPVKMLLNVKEGARMSLMEALTNICMIPVTSLEDIKVSGNWMWPAKLPGEGAALWDACTAFCNLLKELHIAIDGGKDSLSMAATVDSKTIVKSPGSLVVSAYVCCPDVRLVVTPDLKGKANLIWIRMSNDCRIGGSALAQTYCQLGESSPDFKNVSLFQRTWKCLQDLFTKKMVTAAHDISDGGLIGCILEMAFAGNVGCVVDIGFPKDVQLSENIDFEMSVLFNEELGWIIEIPDEFFSYAMDEFNLNNLLFTVIGRSCERFNRFPTFTLAVNGTRILDNYKLGDLRSMWEDTSYQLEKLQCDVECVEKEYEFYKDPIISGCPFDVENFVFNPYTRINTNSIRLAIVREEGSNGDKEMAAAFVRTGFEVWDVAMQDLLSSSTGLDIFKGVVFVGGFSYGDVLGSAKGWAAAIQYNENIRQQFNNFYNRSDTFSLGVCNGCQLLTWLGWLTDDKSTTNSEMKKQDVILTHNDSKRFESRFSVVSIPQNTKSIMLSPLRGTRLGVWVSHGEGKFQLNNQEYFKSEERQSQIALQYVNLDKNDNGTVNYPFNPNGSFNNIAGMCSPNGRHLAMMPHPERSVLWWQWAYTGDLDVSHDASPWLSMFSSALKWCENF